MVNLCYVFCVLCYRPLPFRTLELEEHFLSLYRFCFKTRLISYKLIFFFYTNHRLSGVVHFLTHTSVIAMLGGRAVAPEGMMALWTTPTLITHRACLPSTGLVCRYNYWWGCPTASYSRTRFHFNLSRLLCTVYLFFKLLFCFLLTLLKARGPKNHTSSVFHTEKVLELIHFYKSDPFRQQKMYFATLCPFSIEKIMLAQWRKVLSQRIPVCEGRTTFWVTRASDPIAGVHGGAPDKKPIEWENNDLNN